MTENDPEFFGELDEPDLEQPEDGRDGQPPEEGSQDDPETLDENDPLRDEETVLSDTENPTTVAAPGAAEPLAEDDWALEEQQVLDEDQVEEEFPEDTE